MIAINCTAGMVYQQCGPLCPQTCDTIGGEECNGGCIEGCFCPSEMFTSFGYCISESDCQGMVSDVCNLIILLLVLNC